MHGWADSDNNDVDGSDACPSFDSLILRQAHMLDILELGLLDAKLIDRRIGSDIEQAAHGLGLGTHGRLCL